MELSDLVKTVLENITYDEFIEQEKRASATKKFRFEKDWYYYGARKCTVCAKESHRTGYVGDELICSSCARKVARAAIISISLKAIHKREYSKGVGYGYKLATSSFGKDTITFLNMLVDDAKKEGKTVHFLGRDMDIMFMPFALEDNVNYLPGWNRGFIYNRSEDAKKKLLATQNVQDGDFVVDTGFRGSIINDIRRFVTVKGYLLSAEHDCDYTYLYSESAHQYRGWITEIEHFDRAREVVINPETNLPEETYVKPAWFENGVFHGFMYGTNNPKTEM